MSARLRIVLIPIISILIFSLFSEASATVISNSETIPNQVVYECVGAKTQLRMTKLLKLPCPVVRPRACLHANEARRQIGNELQQLAAPHLRAEELRFARRANAVNSKTVLCQINSDCYDCHGLPLSSEWMRF